MQGFSFICNMSLPIFYQADFPTENFLTLGEETSKHVVQVLRMKVGEKLQLANGKGTIVTASIIDDHKKRCSVKVLNTDFQPKPSYQISIGISLLKNASRLEWFLEKATEIGVTEFIPLLCERTEKQHFKWERVNNILVAAMLQSQQYWLPKLHEATAFKKAVTGSNYAGKFIAHCIDEEKHELISGRDETSNQVLIGPEGDFTEAEIAFALSNQFTPVTLGKTRLRTETAGVVAATLLAH